MDSALLRPGRYNVVVVIVVIIVIIIVCFEDLRFRLSSVYLMKPEGNQLLQ